MASTLYGPLKSEGHAMLGIKNPIEVASVCRNRSGFPKKVRSKRHQIVWHAAFRVRTRPSTAAIFLSGAGEIHCN